MEKIKIKIGDEKTKIISHDIDLIEIFGEETMEIIQNALKMSRYCETKVFLETPILDNCFVKKPDLHVFV